MLIRLVLAGAVFAVLPSAIGLVLAVIAFVLVPRIIRALPTARVQRREAERFERAMLLAEALAAHLVAGVPLLEGLESCAGIDDGDLGRATADCAHLMRLGSNDPFQPWRQWDYLEPLARELTRALVHGGSLASSARRAAQKLRDEHHRRRRMAVERVSVRITAPVSLCLLPAFLLLAVIPPAVSLFGQIDMPSSTVRR